MPQEEITSWDNTKDPASDSKSDIKILSITYIGKDGTTCDEHHAWAAKTDSNYYVLTEAGSLKHKDRNDTYYKADSQLKMVNNIVFDNYVLYLKNALETSYNKALSEFQLQGFNR